MPMTQSTVLDMPILAQSPFTPDEFAALNARFERESPYAILRWAADYFGDRLAVVTSFQPTGIVTLHYLHTIAPSTAVLTLDTGLLFSETYALMDDLEARWSLNLIRVRPALTPAGQAATFGDRLWAREPDRCCNMRKVIPLAPALAPYAAWVTGLRRDQTGRGTTPIVSWDAKYHKVKLCPFATWDDAMIWATIHGEELPYNALHDQNYPSIGCNTPECTRPANADGSGGERAGRWAGSDKIECGLHTSDAPNT